MVQTYVFKSTLLYRGVVNEVDKKNDEIIKQLFWALTTKSIYDVEQFVILSNRVLHSGLGNINFNLENGQITNLNAIVANMKMSVEENA